MKLNWKNTFLIGSGFMAISAMTVLYDSYMPKFYEGFITSSFLIGAIMGIDNFLGMTLQPYFGSLSDRTNTAWGRRRPYILIGLPIASLTIALVPFAKDLGLYPLLLTTVVLNLALSLFRSPTVALMPDVTPPPLRSLANGVINLMGGIGGAFVLVVGAMLFALNPKYPFLMSAGISLLVLFLFGFLVREDTTPAPEATDPPATNLISALVDVWKSQDKSTLFMFLAIFSWFVGYQSINTWFTLYSEQVLNVPVHVASQRLAAFAGAFVLGALPAGHIGTKLGRRNTIVLGLAGLIAMFTVMNFLSDLNQLTVGLVLAGLSWALVNINSYPMVVEMCHPRQIGTFTGLYYIFSGIAGTSGPALFGIVFDQMGSKQLLFILAAGAMVVSLLVVLQVSKGEAANSNIR